LINESMKFYGHKYNKQIRGPSSAAMQKMLSHNWPGNTRELRRIVEGMVVVDSDGVLDVDDLPDELADRDEPAGEPATASLTNLVGKPLDELERLFIAETLRVAGGNREEAARMLGVGERTLYRKIKEYKL
ncbi:MAG: helix-turn-helix domain-containing protein, partial [Planctomycetota bacterium]